MSDTRLVTFLEGVVTGAALASAVAMILAGIHYRRFWGKRR